MEIKTANINIINDVYKTVTGDVVAYLKPQKNRRFVRFVMYCITTTTCSVELLSQVVTRH